MVRNLDATEASTEVTEVSWHKSNKKPMKEHICRYNLRTFNSLSSHHVGINASSGRHNFTVMKNDLVSVNSIMELSRS